MTTTATRSPNEPSIFERMLMMRHFEEAVIRLYKEGRFASHYHIYIGQEATGGAVLEALGDKDLICTTHRNHGHIIGRGCDPGRAMAEILGRATGFNGGRSGTLHISDPSARLSLDLGGRRRLRRTWRPARLSASRSSASRRWRSDSSAMARSKRDWSSSRSTSRRCGSCRSSMSARTIRAGAMGPQQGGYPTAITATESFTRLPAAYGIHYLKVDGTDMAPSMRPRSRRCSAAAPAMARFSSRPSRCDGRAAVRCGRSLRPSPT